MTSIPKHHSEEEGEGDDGVGCWREEERGEGHYTHA